MQDIEMPKLQVLEGKEAITALKEYIRELNEKGDEDLSPSQIKVLIKLADGLISTIESESHPSGSKEKPQILARLKSAIAENLLSIKEDSKHVSEKTTSQYDVLLSPTPQQQRIM